MASSPPTNRDRASFAEEALRLGGKSEEEVRRTGRDGQGRRTGRSAVHAATTRPPTAPIHRAVWEGKVPLELFAAAAAGRPAIPPMPSWQRSLDVVRKRRAMPARCFDDERQGLHRLVARAGGRRLLGHADRPEVRRPGGTVRALHPLPDADRDLDAMSPAWRRSTAASAPSIRCAPSAPRSRSSASCRALASGERFPASP